MSLQGEINKVAAGLADAVKTLGQSGLYDRNGNIRGAQKTAGYVCALHEDESDPLYGTVDVQEYDMGDGEIGFHEGVKLSAIQNNLNGYVVVPAMYSDVVITQDAVTLEEYVTMFSHVKLIQLKSHERVMIGAVRTEEFQEGGDGPDVEELPETGEHATTSYDPAGIVHDVADNDGSSQVIHTAGKITVKAGDSTVSIASDGDVTIEAKNITVKGDNIKHNGGGEKMVKGDTLKSILSELCAACAAINFIVPQAPTGEMPSGPTLNAGVFSTISGKLGTMLSEKSKIE